MVTKFTYIDNSEQNINKQSTKNWSDLKKKSSLQDDWTFYCKLENDRAIFHDIDKI